jgi:transcriptional regulator with XRE-family HTH domain
VAEVAEVSTLPETIRARRKELGLTLEEVAALVGVTPGALSHIESGRRLPDPRNAVAIAQALQLDPDELLNLLDDAHAERRADRAGWSRPNERGSSASRRLNLDSSPVFRAMPIEAMFGEPQASGPATASSADDFALPLPSARLARSKVSAASPRDRARYSPASGERMRAAEELAEDASRAIRTLRGMLDDDDPVIAREARRLLRELDVRGMEE